jgi:dTDP-4-amino-4,6-dideoxygalactose transaminase
MGLTNFESIDSFVENNKRNYECYRDGIARLPGLTLLAYDATEASNFQYIVVEVGSNFPMSRDRVVDALHAENVLARKYFWPGCHNMEPYRSYYPHAGLVLPNTQHVADRVVVLPTGSAIREDDVHAILSILRVLASGTHGSVGASGERSSRTG